MSLTDKSEPLSIPVLLPGTLLGLSKVEDCKLYNSIPPEYQLCTEDLPPFMVNGEVAARIRAAKACALFQCGTNAQGRGP